MRRRLCLLVCAFLPALLPAATPALEGQSGEITVLQAWARATPPGTNVGGAYFTIVNVGDADTLMGVESLVSPRAGVHSMSMKGGMMQMRSLTSVELPAHSRVLFSPAGLHVMLFDLQKPLRQGERLQLTLLFRRAGRVKVEALIGGFGDEGPSVSDDHHGHH